MARKKNKLNEKRCDRNAMIMMYARAYNLHSIDEYKQWCVGNGFSASLNKTRAQLDREHQYYKLQAATKKLKKHKREGNMHHLIQKYIRMRFDIKI